MHHVLIRRVPLPLLTTFPMAIHTLPWNEMLGRPVSSLEFTWTLLDNHRSSRQCALLPNRVAGTGIDFFWAFH